MATKGLCCFDANDTDAFLRLVPGPRDRHGIPEKVRLWERYLAAHSRVQTFRVGLMYGPSGCGKSSLLRAGILPRLPSHVRYVVVEATGTATEATLLNAIRHQFPNMPQMELADTVADLRTGTSLSPGEKLIFVIDQFEQWLHHWQSDAPSSLVQALRQCDGERVQAVLSVRDDFWMPATRFFQELEVELAEGRNAFAVDLFSREHASRY